MYTVADNSDDFYIQLFNNFRSENENITKPAIYHSSPTALKSETLEDSEHKSPTMLTTMQTDSLDSATLDLQISPGGRTDSLLAKDETFPELR